MQRQPAIQLDIPPHLALIFLSKFNAKLVKAVRGTHGPTEEGAHLAHHAYTPAETVSSACFSGSLFLIVGNGGLVVWMVRNCDFSGSGLRLRRDFAVLAG